MMATSGAHFCYRTVAAIMLAYHIVVLYLSYPMGKCVCIGTYTLHFSMLYLLGAPSLAGHEVVSDSNHRATFTPDAKLV
jgi:hypothetical protein